MKTRMRECQSVGFLAVDPPALPLRQQPADAADAADAAVSAAPHAGALPLAAAAAAAAAAEERETKKSQYHHDAKSAESLPLRPPVMPPRDVTFYSFSFSLNDAQRGQW